MNAKNHAGYERLPLLDPSALEPDQQDVYQQMKKTWLPAARQAGFKAETEDGLLLGPYNAVLYSPAIGSALLNYLAAERQGTSLDARMHEVVILTVGAVFRSDYERYSHRPVAAKAGISEADINLLAEGGEPGPDSLLREEERLVQRLVRALCVDHRVAPDLYAQVVEALGHRGMVDVAHLTGLYMLASSLLNLFEIPVPE